jgi:hypothetical protein
VVIVDMIGNGTPVVDLETGEIDYESGHVKITFRNKRMVLPGDVIGSSCPLESGIKNVRHEPLVGRRRPSLFVASKSSGFAEGRWDCTAHSRDGRETPFVVVVRHTAE